MRSSDEGHGLGLQIAEGVAFFENGEIAKVRHHIIYDFIPGKGSQAIGYTIYTFDDGSIIVNRFQRLMVTNQSGSLTAKATSEIIKGTGRFEGIKGTASLTGKNFPRSKGEASKSANGVTFTYTLPPK